MNKIKWIKSRNEYAKKNTYMTSEAIDGDYFLTTNDTPNGNWNLYAFTDSNNMECIEMFHTLSEVKATVKDYK
tara:strand:- start:57 stop:275 length:219 start_codon:yes stop_codon:yes gene_type:complete